MKTNDLQLGECATELYQNETVGFHLSTSVLALSSSCWTNTNP